MELILLVAIFSIAFAIGVLASMTGLGGGFLIVPVLVLLFNMPIKVAIGTSTMIISFVGLSSAFSYCRRDLTDLRLIIPLGIGVGVGAQIGALLTTPIPEDILRRMIAALFIIISLYMFFKKEERAEREYSASSPLLIGIGSLIGVYSGLLGMGGGLFMVPILSILGVPILLAVASSASVTFFAGLSGAIRHQMLAQVDLIVGFSASMGVVLGAQIGPAIATRLKPENLKNAFSILIAAIGVVMLLTQ
ncbi:MAG: sulfite exporter TauE/SafE family protein [Halobacteriota archaeon]|nr:sulfite exporter TauE/SafE family protein [Halobacteriota archaeon]